MFGNNNYAKIWETDRLEHYTTCKITTSRKNKQTNQYETDFSAKVRFVWKAHEKHPQSGDKIKITSCAVTNKYDKEKKITYTNYIVFDYEEVEAKPKPPKPITEAQQCLLNSVEDEDPNWLPF